MSRAFPLLLVASLAALSACAVGPDYRTPVTPVQATFKEAAGWTPSQPMDGLDRGQWWSVYRDKVLDDLERRVSVSNQTLAAQVQAYKQARDVLAQSQAAFFPTLTANASGKKSGANSSPTTTSYTAQGAASWTVDLWGKVRRQIEQARASEQLGAADLANVRLSLQATLASNYFQLRAVDAQKDLLSRTVANDRRALQLTQNQYAAGVSARGDVISARTQLETAQASLVDLDSQRAQLEHAIAVLVGEAPANFSLSPAALPEGAPVAPLNLASTLLQRRPDIAASERAVAAASAGIGVAKASYFPTVTLSATDSSAAARAADLFKAATSSWSYGATAAQSVFDFGAREAIVRESKSIYQQRLAQYRQTVLSAFQNVEDQIAALRALEAEAGYRAAALADAQAAEGIALNQYKAGTVGYSAVIVAQNTALSAAQSSLATQRARLVASVGLIEALGGGWEIKR